MSSAPIILIAVASLLVGAAVVMAFMRRMPAAAAAFAAMAVAGMSGPVDFTASQLWFWGIAAAISEGIRYLSDEPTVTERCYVAGGALVGSIVGLTMGSQAAVIVGAAIGALLGSAARAMGPAGSRNDGERRIFTRTYSAAALPAVVTFSMAMLIFAQLLTL